MTERRDQGWFSRQRRRLTGALRRLGESPEFTDGDDRAAGRRWRVLVVELVGPAGELLPDECRAAIRPHLPEARSLELTGRGDPLLHPHLPDFVREARAADVEVAVRTPGGRLAEETGRALLAAEPDRLIVPLHGAAPGTHDSHAEDPLDVVLAELEGVEGPQLQVDAILRPETIAEVEDLVGLASRVGARRLRLRPWDAFGRHAGLGELLPGPADAPLARDLRRRMSAAAGRAAEAGLELEVFPVDPLEKPVCPADPRDAAFVRADGAVTACPRLAASDVVDGRLPDADLVEIWEGERGRARREALAWRERVRDNRFFMGIGGCHNQYVHWLGVASGEMPPAPPECEGCRHFHEAYGPPGALEV
jgi:MoaA/NifB/PqqE/SkfB family radical SAM enzyme